MNSPYPVRPEDDWTALCWMVQFWGECDTCAHWTKPGPDIWWKKPRKPDNRKDSGLVVLTDPPRCGNSVSPHNGVATESYNRCFKWNPVDEELAETVMLQEQAYEREGIRPEWLDGDRYPRHGLDNL